VRTLDDGAHAIPVPAGLDLGDARLTATIDGDPTHHALAYTRHREGDEPTLRLAVPAANVVLVTAHVTRPDGTPLPLLLARKTRKAWW
jgi:hypothetical protein